MMKEKNDFIDFVNTSSFNSFHLVRITDTEGSTYRKKGAIKIVAPDGESVGLISGGCLEQEIVNKALKATDEAFHHCIDTRKEADRFFGYGIGCDGKIDLHYKKLSKKQLLESDELSFSPQEKLKVYIVGAGPDLNPLIQLLNWSGWDYQVFTNSRDLVEERQKQDWPIKKWEENLFENIDSMERKALLLMSHNFELDLESLRLSLTKNFSYIGILGPAKRKIQMLEDLKSLHQIKLSASQQSLIHGPIGDKRFGKGEMNIALACIADLSLRFFGEASEAR